MPRELGLGKRIPIPSFGYSFRRCFINSAVPDREWQNNGGWGRRKSNREVPVEALDSSSMKTMQKILDILQDAEHYSEGRGLNAKTNVESNLADKLKSDFEVDLGSDLLHYKIIRYLNENEVASHQSLTLNTLGKSYNQYIERIAKACINSSNSYFRQPEVTFGGKLNYYQALAGCFLERDSQTLQKLHNEISRADPFSLNRHLGRKYYFPSLKLPTPHHNATKNPLVMIKALSTSRELNILPFIFDDDNMIDKIIHEYQVRNGFPVTPRQTIKALMKAQQLEGSKIFTVLVRKHLYLRQESIDGSVDDTLNSDFFKSIVAAESMLPSRLMSYRKYQKALLASKLFDASELQVLALLSAQFDRYFGLFYRKNSLDADQWVAAFISFYFNASHIDKDQLKHNSLSYFRSLFTKLEVEDIVFKWENTWSTRDQIDDINNRIYPSF